MMDIVTCHGFSFYRSGHCRQCGACGCGKEPCPHLFEYGDKVWCAIYNERHLVCEVCSEVAGESMTHESCIGFPDNPWIGVVRSGACGFTFERVDGGSMDDLPFLYGESWLRR